MSQCKSHSARMEMPFNLCRIGQLLRETREKRGMTFDDLRKEFERISAF
jgi:hypothetical protein